MLRCRYPFFYNRANLQSKGGGGGGGCGDGNYRVLHTSIFSFISHQRQYYRIYFAEGGGGGGGGYQTPHPPGYAPRQSPTYHGADNQRHSAKQADALL